MRPPRLPIVGLDACVLIEAILFAGSDYPSARILRAARSGVFSVALVAGVEREVRRALRAAGKEVALDELLTACLVVRLPDATAEQLARDKGWSGPLSETSRMPR